jgi:signal transduction histidine kinase/ActR/RegA family two-component response regulator
LRGWLEPPWVAHLESASRAELERRALLDLVRNNTPAAAAHLVVLAGFLYFTSYRADHPTQAIGISIVMAMVTVLRFRYANAIHRREARVPGRDHQIFRLVCCGHAASWSWFTYSALQENQNSWIAFLLVLALSGIANGAMTVLAADLRLSILYTTILASSAVGWAHNLAPFGDFVVALTLLYVVALVVLARQRNYLILDGIRSEMRLEEQTAELRRAKEQAESAGLAKTQFLAAMSHEIRTPLSGVLGLVNMLNETDLDDNQRELTQAIEQSGDLLLTIVNDILDYSKIGAGKLALESVPFDLDEALASVIDPMRKISANKDIHIGLDIARTVPGTVRGDPTRVKQVLSNLLGNAVKFTHAGSIQVKVHAPQPGMIRFSVRDTGIGIAPEAQHRLFEEFSQADQSTARRFGGTGLGLAICRKLVGIMEGSMGVNSVLNEGSTFWFQIPLPEAERPVRQSHHHNHHFAPVQSRATGALHRKLRILVAEDNPVNQRVLAHMLGKMGHQVTLASSGSQAVAEFQRGGLDMILMDCHMPEMDGFEATRTIRKSGSAQANLPIIAVTANAFAEDRTHCLQAGMDDHVSKPVEAGALESVMARMLKFVPQQP